MSIRSFYPLKDNKKRESGSKNVINSNVIIIAKKNGIIAFANDSIDNPEIPDATNRLTPSGGVINPIAKLTTIIIPK